MRMWNVNPQLLCNKHLLGEHVEMHMFVGTINKGKSIQGYIQKGLVNPQQINPRHQALAEEMLARGMNHQSDLDFSSKSLPIHSIAVHHNIKELKRRCPACRQRMEAM